MYVHLGSVAAESHPQARAGTARACCALHTRTPGLMVPRFVVQHCIWRGDAPPLNVWREQTLCRYAVVVGRTGSRKHHGGTHWQGVDSCRNGCDVHPPLAVCEGLVTVFVAHSVAV
jgi:hypothetical protein